MYRENIYDVINATGERVSALLVPINRRLKAYTWKVLGEAGLKMDEAKQIAEDTLEVGGLKLVLRRGENIPQAIVEFARKGEVVLGITGDELYDEKRLQRPNSILRVENTYDWFDEAAKFYRPALCLFNRTGNAGDIPRLKNWNSSSILNSPKLPTAALNEKYLETSKNYLQKSPLTGDIKMWRSMIEGGSNMESYVKRDGKRRGADCGIDIVYTGKTLKELGLKIVDIVRFSDLVVVSPLRNGPTLEALARKASSS